MTRVVWASSLSKNAPKRKRRNRDVTHGGDQNDDSENDGELVASLLRGLLWHGSILSGFDVDHAFIDASGTKLEPFRKLFSENRIDTITVYLHTP